MKGNQGQMQNSFLTSMRQLLVVVGLFSMLTLLVYHTYWSYSLDQFSATNTQVLREMVVDSRSSNSSNADDQIAKDVISISENNTMNSCIARNICKDPKRNPEIYYYVRTNFDELVELPVNYNKTSFNPYPVVPKLVHFCLFRNSEFRFHYMIAIMAASRFVRPDKIFFWHDVPPSGRYWNETLRKVKNIYLVHRDAPTEIRGQKVKVVEHVADIVRLEALLEYGGMYFDTDAIVVNSIDPLLIHDVTMGHAVSSVLANGILFSKPWSDFFKIWHSEYRNFNDQIWGEHSVIKPFQLSKKYPKLIHIEPTSLCRPNWQELSFLFGRNLWDFQRKNFVVHLYMRFGPKGNREMDAEKIRTWNTTAGSIMRYIYYGSATLQTT